MNDVSPVPALRGRHGFQLHPFRRLQDQIDRLFDDFGGFSIASDDLALKPKIDFRETETAFEMTAELPGVGKDDVDLRVTEDSLSLRAEKKSAREEKDDDYQLIERRFGTFQRAMRLPAPVDPDQVDAQFADGVLTVTLPKSPDAEPDSRKVDIK
ncbi:MAG: Hsp20/alpha crystallin family protein [Parasphingopyxis sp.]|uniref:Hsp20/alpha crystallin family protein n=1 Tax=Parasphingopyxis sp. TaxID=1920299 RepID=UPI003FA09D90